LSSDRANALQWHRPTLAGMAHSLTYCLTVLLLTLLPEMAGAQSDQKDARAQLQKLEKEISRIQKVLGSANSQRDKMQTDLRTAEVELGSLQRRIRTSEQDIAAGQSKLAELQAEQAQLEALRDTQKARIGLELKAAWQTGRQGQVKILLSQESPDTLARTLGYYRYFLQARQARLAQYRETLTLLSALRETIDQRLSALAQQQATAEQQRAELGGAQKERQRALAKLSNSINTQAQELQQKQDSRKKLEGLLEAIVEAIDKLEVSDNYQAFASAKGKMPWPLDGKASNRFGKSRNEGKMRWQGITIPAKAGTTVQAIHHGRVVYADWLRGSGLLLIIDHGDGYMSLYANNQSLLRDVGEWVSAGTAISTAGSTGGQERDGLYFEVRQNGKPVDPARWCKR
jgi:septal ring factor EnvC (AmiA/AmiB activator)